MDDTEIAAAFFLRAEAVRQIAMGVFDKTEREVVLKFVAECEALKMALAQAAIFDSRLREVDYMVTPIEEWKTANAAEAG